MGVRDHLCRKGVALLVPTELATPLDFQESDSWQLGPGRRGRPRRPGHRLVTDELRQRDVPRDHGTSQDRVWPDQGTGGDPVIPAGTD
jgi:hypothetical protein